MAPEILTRAEAKARALKRLFTGRPCRRGHICERVVSSYECVECSADRNKKWVAENPEYMTGYRQQYWRKNIEGLKAKQAVRAAKDRDRLLIKRRANAEELRRKIREWQKRNPDKSRLYAHRRRAQKRAASGDYTVEQIRDLLEKQKWKCASCFASLRERYHIDHRVALSRGGSNSITNIELLCATCNSRKYNKDPLVWARENGRLL